MSPPEEHEDERPACMAVLGLLPPYSLEDVKVSYRDKVLAAHPDRGGDAEQFQRLHQAYEDALRYVHVRLDLRGWIAARVEPHLRQEEVADEVRRRGGQVEFEQVDWLQRSFGTGFSMLEERLRRIALQGPGGGDDFLRFLDAHRQGVPYLLDLDLADSPVSDAGLATLRDLEMLRRLGLAGTGVSARGIRRLLRRLPSLEWLDLRRTRLGFFAAWLLRWRFPKVELLLGVPDAAEEADARR